MPDDVIARYELGREYCISAVFPWYFISIPNSCLRSIYEHGAVVYVNAPCSICPIMSVMNATLNDCKAQDASHSTLIRLGDYVSREIIFIVGRRYIAEHAFCRTNHLVCFPLLDCKRNLSEREREKERERIYKNR